MPPDNQAGDKVSQEQPLVKGSLFRGLLKYIGEKLGPEGRTELLKSLDDKDRAVFFKSSDCSDLKMILVTDWYPHTTFANLLKAVVEKIGKGNVSFCKQIGHWSAERDFAGIYKFYNKDAYKNDPNVLYRATPMVWKGMYNKGEMEAVKIKDGRAVMKLNGFREITEAECFLVGGWIERGTQIVSGYKISIEVKYRPTPDIDCEFEVTRKDLLETGVRQATLLSELK